MKTAQKDRNWLPAVIKSWVGAVFLWNADETLKKDWIPFCPSPENAEVRVITPGSFVTDDHKIYRLNVYLNSSCKITKINRG